jgi:hypothetical protein
MQSEEKTGNHQLDWPGFLASLALMSVSLVKQLKKEHG